MNLTTRTPKIPGLLTDWLRPESPFMTDLFDFGSDFIVPRLGVTVPSVNIRETEKDYFFEMAAPGLERKDFNIELDNRTITISVAKEDKKEEKEDEYFRKEYNYRSFSRSFTLPENVKDGNIDARYENGILTVHMPKVKETPVAAVRKIAVG